MAVKVSKLPIANVTVIQNEERRGENEPGT